MKEVLYKGFIFTGYKTPFGGVSLEATGDKGANLNVKNIYNTDDMGLSLSSVNGDEGCRATYQKLNAFYDGLDYLRSEFAELLKS